MSRLSRVLAVWRDRSAITRTGYAAYGGNLLPHLLRAWREPAEEEPHAGRRDFFAPEHTCPACGEDCDCADGVHCGPDPEPAGAVSVPAVRDQGSGHRPAAVVHEAVKEHVGATEEFGAVLAGMRVDLARDAGSLDPDEQAWEAELATFRRQGADARVAFDHRWRVSVDTFAEDIAPGWQEAICERRNCTLCAHDFAEVMEAAGVIALPAVPVDWSTAEWAVVPA